MAARAEMVSEPETAAMGVPAALPLQPRQRPSSPGSAEAEMPIRLAVTAAWAALPETSGRVYEEMGAPGGRGRRDERRNGCRRAVPVASNATAKGGAGGSDESLYGANGGAGASAKAISNATSRGAGNVTVVAAAGASGGDGGCDEGTVSATAVQGNRERRK